MPQSALPLQQRATFTCALLVILFAAVEAAGLAVNKAEVPVSPSPWPWKWVDEPVLLPKQQFFCGVSHKHKFIFQHVPKAAGSSVFFILSLALCHPPDTNPASFRRLPDALCKRGPMQEEFRLVASPVECTKIISSNRSYFRFTFVRHPVPRALSIWKFALGWREDKRSYAKQFPSFEAWITSSNLRQSLEHTTTMGLSHVVQQTDLIADVSGRFAVHFVGRLEHYFSSWLQILDKVPSLPRFRIIELVRKRASMNTSTKWRSKAEALALPEPQAGNHLKEIHEHFHQDYKLLQYDPFAFET